MSAGSQNLSGFQGPQQPNTGSVDLNAISFIASQLISQIATGMPAKVLAVSGTTVDVLPLVNQIDGLGNATPHGTVFGLPFFRLQGGNSAIVIDPVVGDIGWIAPADHDISSVKENRGQANPGSRARFSMADAMFYGGLLNADATQYVKLNDSGITIVAIGDLTATATGDISLTADADISITADAEVDVTATADVSISAGGLVDIEAGAEITVAAGADITLSGEGIATLSAELVMLGPGGGDIATMPAPARTLLTNYAASGPGAIVSNPVAAATTGLNTLLTGSTITTGLANLVSLGTITSGQATAINGALTGGSSLLTACTALTDHTDLLSGLTTPFDATQPFLGGVVGVGAGLDFLAGGFFGSSATAIPAITTALGASGAVTAATTYANGIVGALTLGSVTPAQVVIDVNALSAGLNGYVTNDVAAYATAQTSIAAASGFLGLSADAKNTIPAVETYFGQLATTTTIATLKTV